MATEYLILVSGIALAILAAIPFSTSIIATLSTIACHMDSIAVCLIN